MFFLFIFINLTNYWFWTIISTNLIIGALIVITTLLLNTVVNKKKLLFSNKLSKVYLILFLFLIIAQIKTTKSPSLTNISNDDRRLIDMRLKAYPPVYISLGNKTLWIPAAHWFEERRESIAYNRLSKNLSEVIDPNLYFFANHPRERVGIKETEKYPYLLFPFFVYGVFLILRNKEELLWALSFLVPLLTLTLTGSNNPLGPFGLYPFLTVTTVFGIQKVYYNINTKYPKKSKLYLGTFLVFYLLIITHHYYGNT